MTDRQKQALRKCGIPEAEWAELEATDKRIDRGEKLFDLDPELEAGAKKARQADRKPTERKPREKKQDADKAFLLRVMLKALETHDDKGFGTEFQSEVVNPEREFSFTYNGKKYKVVLSCPRS
jgi:hypothetical protein